jgi:hypothetical protein
VVLRGDELAVTYDLDMSLRDFIDGTYVSTRSTD